jgi:tetratricopeptide (TPR) repeat protein
MPISQMGKNPLETSLVKSAIESYLKGDLTVAQNLLFQELKTNILNHLALNLFAQVFLDRKEYEKAIEYFYKAYEQDPTNYNYLNSFGVANAQYCYINGGDSSSFELAYAAYTKALEINAEFELAYFNRAFLIINCLYNLNLASDLFNNSIIYDALKDLNKLIEINPFSAKAFYLRSIIKYNFKDSWSALADADKSIDLDKYNFEYYFNRATIKNLGIGDYKNGLIDLNISYELTTDNQKKADIKGSSSVCKYQLGDINGACSDAREAYRLSNSITYQELISRFCQ